MHQQSINFLNRSNVATKSLPFWNEIYISQSLHQFWIWCDRMATDLMCSLEIRRRNFVKRIFGRCKFLSGNYLKSIRRKDRTSIVVSPQPSFFFCDSNFPSKYAITDFNPKFSVHSTLMWLCVLSIGIGSFVCVFVEKVINLFCWKARCALHWNGTYAQCTCTLYTNVMVSTDSDYWTLTRSARSTACLISQIQIQIYIQNR